MLGFGIEWSLMSLLRVSELPCFTIIFWSVPVNVTHDVIVCHHFVNVALFVSHSELLACGCVLLRMIKKWNVFQSIQMHALHHDLCSLGVSFDASFHITWCHICWLDCVFRFVVRL